MATHKAVQLNAFSVDEPTSGLEVVQVPTPKPGKGEVLVEVHLRPVNPADVFSIQGVYPGFKPEELPAFPGLEGVGVVVENGEGASKFKAGQRVTGAPFSTVDSGSGTWQQKMVVTEDCLVAVPDSVDDATAAQFWINPVTVYGMLHQLAVPKGDYVLQTAAGSVLGRQLIQLAKHQGVKTINVVRRAAQVQELKDLGADEVIVSTEEDVVQRVKEITGGKGAYGAVECVGGEMTGTICSAVRDGGLVLLYGAMSGLTYTGGIPDILFRGVRLHGFWLVPWTASLPAKERAAAMDAVMDLLAKKVITPYCGTRYPLDKVKEAVDEACAAARGGKVLLEG